MGLNEILIDSSKLHLKLNNIDRKILELLAENGRLGVRELASKLKVSPSTISRKIRKLERKGLIKGYVAIIEDESIGYGCRAVLLVKVSGDIDPNYVINQMVDYETNLQLLLNCRKL